VSVSIQNDYDPEALAQLAQVLAHRLRGLVAGIEGYTDLLADSLMSRDQRELALKILEGAARIESVLADLQLYGETVRPVMLPVHVEELVSALLTPISDEDCERIDIHVDASEGRRLLKADPYLLRQALLVLVQNALEATRRTGSARIEVTSADVPHHIQISVWNDGVIGVENAEHVVFVPFYTTKTHNLGVGLSIARRIAQLHNGSVDLTCNSVEDGVRFSLLLPVAR
jgi:signal transduction histidine kinase